MTRIDQILLKQVQELPRAVGRPKREPSLVNSVMRLYVKGLTYREIAARLGILRDNAIAIIRAARKGTYDECS